MIDDSRDKYLSIGSLKKIDDIARIRAIGCVGDVELLGSSDSGTRWARFELKDGDEQITVSLSAEGYLKYWMFLGEGELIAIQGTIYCEAGNSHEIAGRVLYPVREIVD